MKKQRLQLEKNANPREILLWGAILVICTILLINNILLPSFDETKVTKNKIETETAQLEVYQNFKNLKKTKKSPAKEKRLKRIKGKVRNILESSKSSPDTDISQVVSQVTHNNFSKLVEIKAFKVKEEVEQKGYREVNFEIVMTGEYQNISQFFRALRDLRHLVLTKKIQIKPYALLETGKVEVTADLTLFVTKKAKRLSKDPLKVSPNDPLGTNTAKEFRSPFDSLPNDARSWSLYNLNLTSTISGGSKPTALINGQVFEIGDAIAGGEDYGHWTP